MLEPVQILSANMTDFGDSKVKSSALFMECPFSFRDSVHPQKWKMKPNNEGVEEDFPFQKEVFYFQHVIFLSGDLYILALLGHYC